MIKIDRNKIPIPKIFSSREMEIAKNRLEEFYKGNKDSRSQKRFKQTFEPELRRPILDALNELFDNKCAYCERIIADKKTSNYDHFRPKFGARGLENEFAEEHYWWLTYEWQNLYNSCSECNQFKATWFPVKGKRARSRLSYESIIEREKPLLIDPCNDYPLEHLQFKYSGEVVSTSERGRVTIDILKLNRKSLVESRKRSLSNFLAQWELLMTLLKDKVKNLDLIHDLGVEFESVLNGNPIKAHTGAKRQHLLDLIKEYPEMKGFFKHKQYQEDIETAAIDIQLNPSDIADSVIEIDIDSIDAELGIATEAKTKVNTKQIYLDALEVKNYKCFDHLKLDFHKRKTSTKNGQDWVLFLGENGVGKSSLLKALAMVLAHKNYISKISEFIKADKLLKHGKRVGFIELTYNGGEKIRVSFGKNNKTLMSSLSEPVTNVIGYGSTRLLPRKNIQPENSIYEGVKIANLFDYSVSLENATEWLLRQNMKMFNRAALALKNLLLLNENSILIKEKNEVYIKHSSGSKEVISNLSDGYKTIYALAIDIMSTLTSENVSYDLAEGIILIDEIGIHLHPRWKMQVVSSLRRAFPKLQFFVTTHEPLCLRGLLVKETFVLVRNEFNDIVSINDLPDPSELRIDQILTSEFFGLKSALDPETERVFEEYYELLAKNEKDRTIEDNSRLHELNIQVPRMKHLGNDIRDEIVYYVIDELLAKKVKNEGLKMKDNLKKEALEKVKSLWNSINDGRKI